MNPASNEQDLHHLFTAKADGTIAPEEHERLCAVLKDSANARQQWFAFQDAEAALLAWSQRESLRRDEGAGLHPRGSELGETKRDPANHAHDESPNPRDSLALLPQFLRYFGAVAAGIVISLIAWGLWPKQAEHATPRSSNMAARDEATTSSVAMLSRGVNMEWDRTLAAPVLHAPLPPGVLRLQKGVAEIEFFQGARLCIEGPAEIRLISAGEAFCRYGRFSAHVPSQARGFRLGTPKGDIVDLGTDFGLDLNDTSPELHVFKGEVELHQPRMEMRKLTTGTAAGLGQPAQTLVANAAAFTFSHDLDERVTTSRREAFGRWQTASARWNDDAGIRLHLDFQDEEGARSLRNVAAHGADIAAGTIVGCNWTEGRWPGKRALQFRSMSDRVRLNIPGEYSQFTLAAWVQLHSLSTRQSQSSLCMSEGIEAGGIHWQILYDGSVCLGIVVSAHPKLVDDYISPVVFTPERFGQWMHLAAVLDNAGQEVRFYVNGELLSRHALRRPVQVSPGMAELCNWMPFPNYHGQHPVRNFVGCMDEFTLFARSLSDAEVHQLAAW